MPRIHEQLAQPPRRLLANMGRSSLDKYQRIPDKEPEVTAHVRAMWQDILDDTMHRDDYTAEAWNEITALRTVSEAIIKASGRLVSVTLVDRSEAGGKRSYRYRLEFEHYTFLQQMVFDKQNKLASGRTEAIR
jgi:hypothetical protein